VCLRGGGRCEKKKLLRRCCLRGLGYAHTAKSHTNHTHRYAPSYDALDGGAASDALGFPELRQLLLQQVGAARCQPSPFLCTCQHAEPQP
jgi:hypothetical protein